MRKGIYKLKWNAITSFTGRIERYMENKTPFRRFTKKNANEEETFCYEYVFTFIIG